MQYKTLGNTGILISRLCLGTMTFNGGEGFWKAIGTVDQAGADELVKASTDAGINFYDTADVYFEGESERLSVKPSKPRYCAERCDHRHQSI
jgi:aryl-alcohol dehydrogenase-like predicted oxidoreductase